MGYQALYRKYRPKNLKEVYGQQVAVNILRNAIANKRFGHAYLFTGSRGCGKTSVAKILARMVNCENLIDNQLCGECKSCKASEFNNCVDILEIDAASNNGVDEIRELKSKVNLIPSILKYKVYIIDEVHMLSIGAFNALLKTLEEPPQHVIFILATTELNKVPITILSRCQTIEFKKINNNDMFKRLREIADLEKINITDEAINEIINVSDGGMRDAIGMLDMATSYTNDQITEDDIFSINGNISNNEIDFFTDLIIKENLNVMISLINDYYNTGKDLIKILEKIIVAMTKRMIKENNTNICSKIKILTETVEKMKNSSVGKIYFELAIFEMCCKDENKKIKEVILKKENNDDNTNEAILNKQKINKSNDLKEKDSAEMIEEETTKTLKINEELKKIRINNTFVEVNKQSLMNIKNNWEKLNNYTFDKDKGALVCELLDAVPVAASSKYLILTYSYDSFVEKGNIYIEKYEKTLKEILGIDIKLVFLTNEEWLKFKNEYIENVKNNVKYNYIDESLKNTDEIQEDKSSNKKKQSEIIEKVNQLFDMSKIEIKEKI